MDIKKAQGEANELLKNIKHPRFGTVLGLYEEVGELAKVVMNWEIYGEKDRDNLEEECADIIFSVIDVANAYGVDLDSACEIKFNKTKQKIGKWEEKYGKRLSHLREILDNNE